MSSESHRLFAPTRWSLVHRARGDSPEARAALAELCEAYWQPVHRVLRRAGRDDEAARELAQAFFAHVLEGGRLDAANPAGGRFRSYLLGALRHFESDLRHRAARLKRGGGVLTESTDPSEMAASIEADLPWDDGRFDREWALNIIDRALGEIGRGYEESGRKDQFERLRPALAGGELPAHADLASELGITEGAVKVAIHRLRRRFRDVVRAEIIQTLPQGADPDEELRYLVEVLARSAGGGRGLDLPSRGGGG